MIACCRGRFEFGYYLLLAWGFLFAMEGDVLAGDGIFVSQHVSQIGRAVYAHISLENRSGPSFLVEKLPLVRERTLGESFLLKSADQEIGFVGALVKRKPYDKSDFFELKAGQVQQLIIRLDLDYQFLEGDREYEVSYIFLTYDPDKDLVASHSSSYVSFRHNKN